MTITTKIRWGLLSTARINRRLIPAIRQSERGELVAVASRSLESAQAYATEWDIPIAYGSYEDLLAADTVDAVYISLPNHLHAEWSIKALEAGKHVLCEKPFALTVADADAMFAAAEHTGKVLMEAFMYRHHPQTLKLKQLLDDGAIGDIKLIRAHFSFPLDNDANIRLHPEKGGGALWDVGCYPMSIAQYIAGGAPTEIAVQQAFDANGVDRTTTAQLRYENGVMAQISCSFEMQFSTSLEVQGSLGRLTCDWPFVGIQENDGPHLIVTGEDREPQQIQYDGYDEYLYLGQVNNMHAAILDGAPIRVTHAETRLHVATLTRLYAAGKTTQ